MKRQARFASGLLLILTSAASAPASAQELFAKQAVGFPLSPRADGGWTNYAVLADIDGDGDLDALMPNAPGFFSNGGKEAFGVYENNGSAQMTDVSQAAVGGYEG